MNIFDNSFKTLALFRAVFYLAITVESIFLSYLYWNAYRKFKTTPIIKSLQMLLFSIGVNFFYMTIIALIAVIDSKSIVYNMAIVLIPLSALPLMFSLKDFMDRSTEIAKDDSDKLIKTYENI